uniref:Alkane hydroxylase n=1 Tax=Dietzia sp. K44 TaxID=301824 RepID=Q5PY67_9ACTN|nr:alkane hydroxylase [Dietzia sp. K44]
MVDMAAEARQLRVDDDRGATRVTTLRMIEKDGTSNETLWAFLPRKLFRSLTSAWHLESERLRRLGKSPWTLRNDNLNAWLMTVVLFGGLIAVFGWEIAPWLIVQAVFSFSLLEVVNYLEHYGLLRQKTAAGCYQRCRRKHSWYSDAC